MFKGRIQADPKGRQLEILDFQWKDISFGDLDLDVLNDDDGCSGGIDNEVDDSEYDEYDDDDDDQLHLQYNDNDTYEYDDDAFVDLMTKLHAK